MINLQTIRTPEPRAILRLAFQVAINTCSTMGARMEYEAALDWYEQRWQVMDRMAQEKAKRQQAQPTAQAQADGGADTSKKFSAVEQFGHDSPQAEAMREARRDARAALAADGDEGDAGQDGPDGALADSEGSVPRDEGGEPPPADA